MLKISKVFTILFGGIFLLIVFLRGIIFAQAPVVYPLHIGDYWYYNPYFIHEITKDTVMANGLTYAKIVSSSTIENPQFQRFSNDSVYNYQYDDLNNLLYDFSMSQGDTTTIIIWGSDTLDIILKWAGVTNIFGRQRRQWEFFFDVRNLFDEEETHWITDSLGLTKWADNFYFYNLQGAVINGDTFGVVTEIEDEHLSVPLNYELF